MLKIVTAPNPVLSQKAKKINKIDKSILNLIEEMKKSLLLARDPVGVGLAAPQVGKSLRIFLAKPTEESNFCIFINPEILKKSPEKGYVKRPASPPASPRGEQGGPKKDTSEKSSKQLEGCLSLPTIWGPVLRSSSLLLSFLDENGISHKKKFSGFMATIIQHEIDHLDGILFPKRVLEQKGILYKSRKDEKGEDVFEEIEI